MKYALLFFILVLSGCASAPLVTKTGTLSGEVKPGKEYGYIAGFIGATTLESTKGVLLGSKIIISYEDSPSPGATIMLLGRVGEPIDLDTEYVIGRAFLIKVPVGTYSINSVGFHGIGRGGSSITTGSKYAIGYHFDVKQKKIVYIGSFVAESYLRDTMFGKVKTGKGYFTHSFNLERDLKLLSQKYSQIDFESYEVISTTSHVFAPPLVYRK